VRWIERGEPREARWRSEAEAPAPERVSLADDRTTADQALARIRRGQHLLYTGDFHNARQLLAAVARRLERSRQPQREKPCSIAEAFRAERRHRAEEHALLNRLLVPLDASYRVALRRGVDLSSACSHAWGAPDAERTVTSLRELLGIAGSEQWRRKGVAVPGLPGPIHPHYGVFSPTRPEYPRLIALAPAPNGKRVFDVGTGTGVLGLLMLARGAREVVATDNDPRAVVCANENAARLGYGDRFVAIEADLFPSGRADVVVCNPPWVPEVPRTPMDRAVYDPDAALLKRFLVGLGDHLEPGGEGWLILSDLAELLELRPRAWLGEAIREAGLGVAWKRSTKPEHRRAQDRDDPLHAARSQESTTLYALSTARNSYA
jgi:SAM-dependent methyltransferase